MSSHHFLCFENIIQFVITTQICVKGLANSIFYGVNNIFSSFKRSQCRLPNLMHIFVRLTNRIKRNCVCRINGPRLFDPKSMMPMGTICLAREIRSKTKKRVKNKHIVALPPVSITLLRSLQLNLIR